MTLLELQAAFRDEIAASDDAGPASSVGMRIYRDAYRGRLLGALEDSFARTRRWTGDDAFIAAACHYVLLHPPHGWTLDDYGDRFPEVLAALFADDPEVADLAWFEWSMQRAFAARDYVPLDPAELGARGYGEAEWQRLRFAMAPGFALRRVTTDCTALWTALADDTGTPAGAAAVAERWVVVWRKGLSPHCRMLDSGEALALAQLERGETFGSVAQQADPQQLGTWLAEWLDAGLFFGAETARH